MKFVVDSMPVWANECLFCANKYTDMCSIDDSLCYLSLKYKGERKCPYLIELQVKEGSIF